MDFSGGGVLIGPLVGFCRPNTKLNYLPAVRIFAKFNFLEFAARPTMMLSARLIIAVGGGAKPIARAALRMVRRGIPRIYRAVHGMDPHTLRRA